MTGQHMRRLGGTPWLLRFARRAAILGLIVSIPGGPGAYAQTVTITVNLNVTVTASVDVAKVRSATRSAIGSFLSDRANLLTSNSLDTSRMHDRLRGGSLFARSEESEADERAPTGFGRSSVPQRFGLGGDLLPGHGGPGTSAALAALVTGPRDRFAPGSGGAGLNLDDEDTAWTREGRPPDARRDTSAFPFSFGGSAEDGFGRFQFATSLSMMQAAAEAEQREKRASLPSEAAARLGLTQGGHDDGASRPAIFDVWLEGHSAYFETDRQDGRRRGHAAIVSAGADVILRPGVLLGIMAQVDWMSDSSPEIGRNREGRGWMAGPYLSLRLTPHLYFDARAAWGTSTNTIDPLGYYVDTFETERALVSAKLTGNWTFEALRLRPSAEVLWFKEKQNAYENAIGIAIGSQSYSLGRAVVGPEIGYRLELSDNSVVEPFLGVKAVWDFANSQVLTAAGEPIGHDGLTARAEAGLSYRLPSGISIQAAGSYDGIGGDRYEAVQGRARVTIPLQ